MNRTTHADENAARTAAMPDGLLVVTIDRLPAWMLAPYGATWVATPALDSLAARGIVFDRVIAPSLEVRDTLHDLAAAAPAGPSLFAAAAAVGWRAAVVTDDSAVAGSMAEQIAGRDGRTVRLVESVAQSQVAVDDTQTNAARLVDEAISVIASGTHRLVWCHVGSLGVAWDAPEHYRDRYTDPEDPPPPSGARVPGFPVDATTDPDVVAGMRHVFAGQLSHLDGQLGRLFAAVPQVGPTAADRQPVAGSVRAGGWAVLVVGVRGLPLGLHGWMGVGGAVLPYGELIHVPAIIVDGAGRMAAQRHGGLVVPADLAATLLDLGPRRTEAGSPPSAIDPAAPWLGASLARLFDDWSAPVRDRVVVVGPDGAAIVTPAWHAVLARGASAAGQAGPEARGQESRAPWKLRLFAKPDDYFEQADVADRCGGVADRFTDVAALALGAERDRAWMAALPEPGAGLHSAP